MLVSVVVKVMMYDYGMLFFVRIVYKIGLINVPELVVGSCNLSFGGWVRVFTCMDLCWITG